MQNTLFVKKAPTCPATNMAIETKLDELSRPWKVALIDDEEDVIKVSELVLKRVSVDDRPLKFLKANSAKEAKVLFENNPDIAIALVDVVMEDDHAGLELVKWIRESHKNTSTRLVLRTGQPGQAPEEDVIRDYDINDYKNKTELNSTRLKTIIYSAIRSYRDIKEVEKGHKGLEEVVRSTTRVLQASSSEEYAHLVVGEVKKLLQQERVEFSLFYQMHNALGDVETIQLMSDGLSFKVDNIGDTSFFSGSTHEHFMKSLELKEDVVISDKLFCYTTLSEKNDCCITSVSIPSNITGLTRRLLNVFLTKVSIIFDSLTAKEEVERTQQELMFVLGEAIEKRSKETGCHVRRVSLICEFLAQRLGLEDSFVHLIKHATPMHDIGKIAIPEHILHKPAKLDQDEWRTMQTHAKMGHDLLQHSSRALAKVGASIALHHHEKWDGSGYPQGLSGADIPIEGRLMAIADVIDALAARRSYKEPWSNDRILKLLIEERGKHFDPEICDLAIKHFDQIMALRSIYPDE